MSAETEFVERADPYRRELLAHCYRMLGSVHDAEDLVQETYLRAWRGYAEFQGRSSIRTWLYRIATNVCLNALGHRERRVTPAGLGGPSPVPDEPLTDRLLEVAWLEPMPDALLDDDPASIAARRESTRLAFVAALQLLPARQRAALLLRDVVGLTAAETAAQLGITAAAANSALQRARAHIDELAPTQDTVIAAEAERATINQLVTAFERADIDALARMLREDVEMEMPPVPMWFAGRASVLTFFERFVFPVPRRYVLTTSNGNPAVASYRIEADGRFHAHHILCVELRGPQVGWLYAFLGAAQFEAFHLPLTR